MIVGNDSNASHSGFVCGGFQKSNGRENKSGEKPFLNPLTYHKVDRSLDPNFKCLYCCDTGHIKANCKQLQRRLAQERAARESIDVQETLQNDNCH